MPRSPPCTPGMQEICLAYNRYHIRVSFSILVSRGWQINWMSMIIFFFFGRLGRLVEILKHRPSPQMSYQVSFCFWLLSFEQDVVEQINKSALSTFISAIKICRPLMAIVVTRKYDIIPLLIDVAQAAVKEKVIRVVVATFRVSSFFLKKNA